MCVCTCKGLKYNFNNIIKLLGYNVRVKNATTLCCYEQKCSDKKENKYSKVYKVVLSKGNLV